METTQECWQALIDGETLIGMDTGRKVIMRDNAPVFVDSKAPVPAFNEPECWNIYTPPKWYDNIPEGGVLCWVSDTDPLPDSSNCFAMVLKHSAERGFATKTGAVWKHATPLPKQEIQVLKDNAPEGEGG